MHVLTYFEPVPEHPDESDLLKLWEPNWRRLGWSTEILHESIARRHCAFEWFSAATAALPSVEGPSFRRVNWLRWLAMDQWFKEHGQETAAVMSDWDVLNRSLEPHHVLGLLEVNGLLVMRSAPHSPGSGTWAVTRDASPMLVAMMPEAGRLNVVNLPEGHHTGDMNARQWIEQRAKLVMRMPWEIQFDEHFDSVIRHYGPTLPLLVHIVRDYPWRVGLRRVDVWKELEAKLCKS